MQVLKRIAAPAAVGLAAAAITAPPATATEESPSSCSIVGDWDAINSWQDQSYRVKIGYSRTGRVDLKESPGGTNSGKGSWRTKAGTPCAFDVRMIERPTDPDSEVAVIDIRYTAIVRGSRYSSEGVSTAYDRSGKPIRTVDTRQTATRSRK